jgi:hypothetical protein
MGLQGAAHDTSGQAATLLQLNDDPMASAKKIAFEWSHVYDCSRSVPWIVCCHAWVLLLYCVHVCRRQEDDCFFAEWKCVQV